MPYECVGMTAKGYNPNTYTRTDSYRNILLKEYISISELTSKEDANGGNGQLYAMTMHSRNISVCV